MTDPLWQAATGELHSSKLLCLAVNGALRGYTVEAKVSLRTTLTAFDHEGGALNEWFRIDEAAFVQVMTGETTTALDWARGVLEYPESILWIEPLVRVLLLAGNRDQVEDLAAASSVRREIVDRWFDVGADDAAFLATAESLITGAALERLHGRRSHVDDRSCQMAPGG